MIRLKTSEKDGEVSNREGSKSRDMIKSKINMYIYAADDIEKA